MISVVIPTRGGRERLPGLIAGLQAQTHHDFEAIVVIDGDIDESASLFRELDDPRFTAITFTENRGRAAALNAGFAAANGELLMRCDDDLGLTPAHLATHLSLHQTHEAQDDRALGLIGMCRNLYAETPYAAAYGRPRDERLRADAYAAEPAQRWRYWAANVSVRPGTYLEIGPYDESFRAYGWEDVDWGWRLHQHGCPITISPALEATHDVAATNAGARASRAFSSGAARHRFERKHGSAMLPTAKPTGRWGALVGALAARLRSDNLDTWGARMESVAQRSPARAGEKAIALLIEAAALAGYREGASDG